MFFRVGNRNNARGRFYLSDCRLSLSRHSIYSITSLSVRFAKIKFLRNNRYPINDRRYTKCDRRSFTDQVSENSTEVGSRFFLFLFFFAFLSHSLFLSPFCLKCESRNGTFKANFGPVVIISKKNSDVPSEICSSSCLSSLSFFLFPRYLFPLLFRDESRIPSCERRFSRGQCGSALLFVRVFYFVSLRASVRRN